MCEIKSAFNELRDLHEVDQFGFVDLGESFASGNIPASVAAPESSFDAPAGTPLAPSQIGGVPADVFDAFEMREQVRASIKKSAEAKPSASSQAEPEPAASE